MGDAGRWPFCGRSEKYDPLTGSNTCTACSLVSLTITRPRLSVAMPYGNIKDGSGSWEPIIFLNAHFKKGPLPALKSLPDENDLMNLIRALSGAGGRTRGAVPFRGGLLPKAVSKKSVGAAAKMAVLFHHQYSL